MLFPLGLGGFVLPFTIGELIVVAHPGESIDSPEEKRFRRGQAVTLGALFIPAGYRVGLCADKPYPELQPSP
jgi:hypothetical protein